MSQFNPQVYGSGESSPDQGEKLTADLRERCATELISYRELFTKLMPHTLSLLVGMLRQIEDLRFIQERDSEPQKALTQLFAEVEKSFAASDVLCKDLSAAGTEQELRDAISNSRKMASGTLELVQRSESFLLSQSTEYCQGIREYLEQRGEEAERDELNQNEFVGIESFKDSAAEIVVNLRVLAQDEQQATTGGSLADLLALTSSRGVFVKQALNSESPVPAVLDVANTVVKVADAIYSGMVAIQQNFATNEQELTAYLTAVDPEESIARRLKGLESLIAAPAPLNAAVSEGGVIRFSYTLPQAAEVLGIELTQGTKRALEAESGEIERRGMRTEVLCGLEGESFVFTVLLHVPVVGEKNQRVQPETMRVMRRDARKKKEIVGGDFIGFDLVRDPKEPLNVAPVTHPTVRDNVLGISFPRSMVSSEGGRKFLGAAAAVSSLLADTLGAREWCLFSRGEDTEEVEEGDDLCIDPSTYALRFISSPNSDISIGEAEVIAESRRYLEGWRKVPGSANEFKPSVVIEPLIVIPADYVMNGTLLKAVAAVSSVARINYLDFTEFECRDEEVLTLLNKAKGLLERIRAENPKLSDLVVWFDAVTGNVPFRQLSFDLTDSNLTLVGRCSIGLDGSAKETVHLYPWVELAKLNQVVSGVIGEDLGSVARLRATLSEKLRDERFNISGLLIETIVQNRITSLYPFTPLEAARLVTRFLRTEIDKLIISANAPGFNLSIITRKEAAS